MRPRLDKTTGFGLIDLAQEAAMIGTYNGFFATFPALEKGLKALIEQHQDLRDNHWFLDTLWAIAQIRPRAFNRDILPQEPSDSEIAQMEIFLFNREEAGNVMRWIIGYRNEMNRQTLRLATAYQRPEMTRQSVSFLYRCARRLVEDYRAEIGRKHRSRQPRDPNRLDAADWPIRSKG
jgi:hypothetical protein